ncbi:hypothetical protein FIBSPDRAFT_955672 [Athelia psychrophila]|uniref:Uncharacterized protein n=1 Tax=Athelia psychrophila TaxID=1759441 RepID=A0A166HQM2_9AGAM|nr:hypothetical protein FIBSPDRAFT_955672 [Fibularhizoctonia sp. CBS 109695]
MPAPVVLHLAPNFHPPRLARIHPEPASRLTPSRPRVQRPERPSSIHARPLAQLSRAPSHPCSPRAPSSPSLRACIGHHALPASTRAPSCPALACAQPSVPQARPVSAASPLAQPSTRPPLRPHQPSIAPSFPTRISPPREPAIYARTQAHLQMPASALAASVPLRALRSWCTLGSLPCRAPDHLPLLQPACCPADTSLRSASLRRCPAQLFPQSGEIT